jgi:hypothetical protein
MPQGSQFVGVNSVTNIELDKGVLPAPVFRNADWLESLTCPYRWPRPVARLVMSEDAGRCILCGFVQCSLVIQDSGKWPIC